MSYTFNDIMEFKEFVSDSFERGDYAQEMENFNKGINTISNDKLRWDWLEGEKLYLANNAGGDLFIIYQHPFEGFEQYLWFCSVKKGGNFHGGKVILSQTRYCDTWDMGTSTPDGYNPLGGVCWVREYMVLDSHSLTFMNWINEHPMEAK